MCVVGGRVGVVTRISGSFLIRGPVSLAQWGCMLITYLIREEFKLCVLGRGQAGGREPPLETSSLNLDLLW